MVAASRARVAVAAHAAVVVRSDWFDIKDVKINKKRWHKFEDILIGTFNFIFAPSPLTIIWGHFITDHPTKKWTAVRVPPSKIVPPWHVQPWSLKLAIIIPTSLVSDQRKCVSIQTHSLNDSLWGRWVPPGAAGARLGEEEDSFDVLLPPFLRRRP